MKKRHAWIWLVSGICLIIGTAPIPISWICSRNIEGDARAHYLNGLGQIAGLLGKDEAQWSLEHKAELLLHDRVEVVVEFADIKEREEVLERLVVRGSWIDRGNLSWRANGIRANVTYQMHSSVKPEFIVAMNQARERPKEEIKVERRTRPMLPRQLPVPPRDIRMPRIEAEQDGAGQPPTRPEFE